MATAEKHLLTDDIGVCFSTEKAEMTKDIYVSEDNFVKTNKSINNNIKRLKASSWKRYATRNYGGW